MMMTEVLAYLRNWFTRSQHYGQFTVKDGAIVTQYDTGTAFDTLPVIDGQYFRIIGSALNDGVYAYPALLRDEVFDGAVWLLAVPPAVVEIAAEIEIWNEKNGAADSAALSPFASESFGGYSYTKASAGGSGGSGAAVTWRDVYGARLAPWRKI